MDAATQQAIDAITAADTSTVGTSTTSTVEGTAVIVDQDPQTLADAAGLSLDVYIVACMVASEEYDGTPQELLALAECAVNYAALAGIAPSAMLLRSVGKNKTPDADGKRSNQVAGKWASTRLDPDAKHVAAANGAVGGGTSLTDGGIDFFDPGLQATGVQGNAAITQSVNGYISNNTKQNWGWIGDVDGIDPGHLAVFRKSTDAETDNASLTLALQGVNDAPADSTPADEVAEPRDNSDPDPVASSSGSISPWLAVGLVVLVVGLAVALG